jgi:hypothetical protein
VPDAGTDEEEEPRETGKVIVEKQFSEAFYAHVESECETDCGDAEECPQ